MSVCCVCNVFYLYVVLVEASRECSALIECNEENHTVSVTGPQPAITTPNISSFQPERQKHKRTHYHHTIYRKLVYVKSNHISN